jgi:hypothetical protein
VVGLNGHARAAINGINEVEEMILVLMDRGAEYHGFYCRSRIFLLTENFYRNKKAIYDLVY